MQLNKTKRVAYEIHCWSSDHILKTIELDGSQVFLTLIKVIR